MSAWCEDFAATSLEEILQCQTQNRAWGKELRGKNNSLVNSRLAHELSFADYLTDRKLVRDAAAEYRRRATVLDAQIVRCTGGALPQGELKPVQR